VKPKVASSAEWFTGITVRNFVIVFELRMNGLVNG